MERLGVGLGLGVRGLESAWMGLGGVRHKITMPSNRAARKLEGGIKYTGFTYFPRFPDQVDPPYEPTKLLAVRRVKSLKGKPYWERRVMEQDLKLQARRSVAIVKNTPTANVLLYKVKHLIEITPIRCPNGLPEDPNNAFLKENGDFIVYDKLGTHGIKHLQQVEEDVEKVRRRSVDIATMKRRLNLNWYNRW